MSTGPSSSRSSRREARERAVELTYEATARRWTVDQIVGSLLVRPEPFAVDLLRSVESNQIQIDDLLRERARGWSLERMPTIDLIVMRLGVAEMLSEDTPTGVILAEATALAGLYSTDESSRFVNGLLAAIAKDLRPA